MADSNINFRIEQFSKFYDLLMSNAPEGYIAWIFTCEKNGKNPMKGVSWKSEYARLTKQGAIEQIKKGYNLGLSARAEDCLVLGDIDNPNYLDQMPEYTLTDISRKRIGGHFFGLDKDGTAKINQPTDNGEMRSIDMYVLIPGSYVPLNLEDEKDKKFFNSLTDAQKQDNLLGYYTISSEYPLRELSFDDLPEFFKEANIQDEKIQEELRIKFKDTPKKEFNGKGKYSELLNLKVSDIVGNIPSTRRFGHPLHDSDTDANFSIDNKGLGHCWRDSVTLNAVQFLCVKAGYKKCFEAGTPHKEKGKAKKYSQIKGDKQALEVAYQEALKMGLIREYVPEQNAEPKGWACAINIKKFALKHNFVKCHICNSDFQFNEKLGWYSCPTCNFKGGLKQFAELIIKQRCIKCN